MGTSWLDIADYLRSTNGLDDIEARLRAGDYYGVVQGVEDAARRFATETHSGFVTAGRAGSEWLDSQLPDRLVRFDVTNQRAIQAARQNELELVHGLTQETRQTVHQILVDGTARSENPRVMARSIRDSIGLAPNQEQAVRSYRAALEHGDWSNALGRELSSGHSDRTIRRAQAGGSLSQDQIDTAVERYRQNALTYRAETIARTEAGRNVHAGLDAAFTQAIERGDVEAKDLVKEWIHARRGIHSRSGHQDMDGKTVPFTEDFSLPSGARIKYPHAAGAPVEEVANCRCTYSTSMSETARAESAAPQQSSEADAVPTEPAKNPKRVAAARVAAAASVERRREIHSAVATNLPEELQSAWDKEGHKFMREEADRIRGVKDRVNAASTLSQAFAEKYGSGAETMFGNEGDRYHLRAEIEAKAAESWADEQERKYYAAAQEAYQRGEFDEDSTLAPPKTTDDEDPPF